jgi:aspartate ammonia-lyase
MILSLDTIANAAKRIGISTEDLAAVARQGAAVSFAAGEYLFHESTPREWLGVVLEGEGHPPALGGKREPDRRVAAAAVAVLHGVQEKLLDHEVGLEASLARHGRALAEILDERAGAFPRLQAGRKHRHSGCDGVHRQGSPRFGIIGMQKRLTRQ